MLDVILTAFVIGLAAAVCCFRELRRHTNALQTLRHELSAGSADRQETLLRERFPSVFTHADIGPREDELLAERLAYLERAHRDTEGRGVTYSPAEMSEMSYARLNGRYCVSILHQVAAILLIAGICGTLWNVSSVLAKSTPQDLLNSAEFSKSLWHSMLAIPFTVVLTACYEVYKSRQNTYLTRLDLFTAEKLLPLMKPSEHLPLAQRLVRAMVPLSASELRSFAQDAPLFAALPEQLLRQIGELHHAYERRRDHSKQLRQEWEDGKREALAKSEQTDTLLHAIELLREQLGEIEKAWQQLTMEAEPAPLSEERPQTALDTIRAAWQQTDAALRGIERHPLTETNEEMRESTDALASLRRAAEHRRNSLRQLAAGTAAELRRLRAIQEQLRRDADDADDTLRHYTAETKQRKEEHS